MNLLIVEDNLDILSALTDLFEGEGHTVRKSPTVEEAFKILSESSPPHLDCIILDNFMPGMTGQDLLNEMAKPGFPAGGLRPIILITTNPHLIDISQVPCPVMLLPKPIDVEELLRTLNSIPSWPPAKRPES